MERIWTAVSLRQAMRGRHKHSLQTPKCPDANLPDGVIDRPDLAGYSMPEVFMEFCKMAGSEFAGQFYAPNEAFVSAGVVVYEAILGGWSAELA